jgi:hypothetical protein
MARLFAANPPRPAFALLAPDCSDKSVRYALYVDGDVSPECEDFLDRHLKENPQYAYARTLGQLGPPKVFRISGDAYAKYCRRLCSLGQRLGDIKPAVLSTIDGWSAWFDLFSA